MKTERVSPRLPSWLKKRIPAGPEAAKVRSILKDLRLNTVCRSALCPNAVECFHKGTATFLIMGPTCTRNCSFCAVNQGEPTPLEPDEPERVAEAVKALALTHVVVTSVTRDDIADGGAAHFAATIGAVRSVSDAAVEVLVPDFRGSRESVRRVVDARPDVFNHNIETVPSRYPAVRPQANYERSLAVLAAAKELDDAMTTKSGLMVGVGEMREEVVAAFGDLRAARVDVVTVGQYLAPSKRHLPVARFVPPEEFAGLERVALDMGFAAAQCGPFVRSSYHAGEVFSRRAK